MMIVDLPRLWRKRDPRFGQVRVSPNPNPNPNPNLAEARVALAPEAR